MTTKKQNKTSGKEATGKIKNLKIKKQTVRDLSVEDSGKVKGGGTTTADCSDVCLRK
jgi:hypothetical protein